MPCRNQTHLLDGHVLFEFASISSPQLARIQTPSQSLKVLRLSVWKSVGCILCVAFHNLESLFLFILVSRDKEVPLRPMYWRIPGFCTMNKSEWTHCRKSWALPDLVFYSITWELKSRALTCIVHVHAIWSPWDPPKWSCHREVCPNRYSIIPLWLANLRPASHSLAVSPESVQTWSCPQVRLPVGWGLMLKNVTSLKVAYSCLQCASVEL